MESTSFTLQVKPQTTIGNETPSFSSTNSSNTDPSTVSTLASCLETTSLSKQPSFLSEVETVETFLKTQPQRKQNDDFLLAVKSLPISVQNLLNARGIYCCNWDSLKIDPTSPEAAPFIKEYINANKDHLIIDLHAWVVTRQLPAITSNLEHTPLQDVIKAAENFLETHLKVELRPSSLMTPSFEKAKPFNTDISYLPNLVKEIAYTHCIGVLIGCSIGRKNLKTINLHTLVKQTIDPNHPQVMNRIENQIRNEMWQCKEFIRCWVLQQKRVTHVTDSN